MQVLVSLFVETYGTERGNGTADDIMKDLKIGFECRSGAVAAPLSSGYQETAAYCQFGWEPHRKKIASTSNGGSGTLQVSAYPQRVLARAAVGRDTPCMWVSARCGSALARVVLQGLDMSTPVEQGIEVPKITLEEGIPQRAVPREPLPVESWRMSTESRGRCALGVVWYHVAARGGRSYWWMGGSSHVQWLHPQEFTASPGR